MRVLKEIIHRGFDRLLSRLDRSQLAYLLERIVESRAAALPADEALRFLFDLDARLYRVQGETSVRHGNGLHSKHRHTRYHDFFTGRIKEGERVLDVGCGVGALAHDVAERSGADVVGIDLSEANVAAARERFSHPRVTFLAGDALRHLPDGPFHVVILSNVLEHLADRASFLRRLAETAAPARFLIRVPLFERDWRVPLKREVGAEWRLDLTHHTEYTLESFAEEMAAAGLRVVHQEVRWGEIWSELCPQ